MNKLDAVIRSVAAVAGPRPHFLNDPDNDRLLAIIMALAGELSSVYERLDSLEAVLASDFKLDRSKIDNFMPDADTAKARLDWQSAYVRRLLRILELELNELKDPGEELPGGMPRE
jgi:hypothetical protein